MIMNGSSFAIPSAVFAFQDVQVISPVPTGADFFIIMLRKGVTHAAAAAYPFALAGAAGRHDPIRPFMISNLKLLALAARQAVSILGALRIF